MLTGVVIGLFVGFFAAVYCECNIEKDAVEQGYMKIYGEYYKITKLEKMPWLGGSDL